MLPDISNTDHLFITQDVDAFEDHAEDLMDDLFGDVEHILNVNSSQVTKLSSRPTANLARAIKSNSIQAFKSEVQEYSSADSVSLTKIDLPGVRMPSISRQDILWIEPHIAHSAEISTVSTQVVENREQKSSSNFLDRFLFGTACISVVLTAVLWLVNHGLLGNTTHKMGSEPVAKTQVVSESAKFAEEIRTALVSVNTKPVPNTSGLTNPTTGNPQNIATAPVLNNGQVPIIMNPLVAANGQNGQTIYIPVYQPSGLTNTGNNVITAPSTLSSKAPANNSPANNIAAATPVHTLVGVLELGDRSSALLNVDGAVQSVRIGMSIGNSGWTLNRVGQQEIIIKRGSEVRSVFVGQRF